MNIKMIKAAFVPIIFSASSLVHAGIIQSVSSDDVGANLGGLEWLEFTNTFGLSSSNVATNILSTYDGGGWRYATTTEAEDLITSLAGGSIPIHGWHDQYFAGVNWFQSAFGSFPQGQWTEHYFMYAPSGASGYAGYTALSSTQGWLHDSWGLNESSARNVIDLSSGDARYAHMLVRDLSSPLPSVPEPSTLAIFALGMIGLASRRFKKQS